MSRFARRRSATAVFAIVVSICALLVSTGSAAQLDLSADGTIAFAQGAGRCTDGPLTVTPSGSQASGGTYTEVTVSGITGDCTGGNVSVYTTPSPHTVLFTGAGAVSGSTMTVTSSPFTPTEAGVDVVVGLDGWAVPAVWSFAEAEAAPAPITPGDTTEFVGSGPSWSIQGNGNQFCVVTTVTGTSPEARPWTIDLHVAQRPFNGITQSSQLAIDDNNGLPYSWVRPNVVNGVLQITGHGTRATITSGQQYSVKVCAWSTPIPSYDATLDYTMTTSLSGNVNHGCIDVTVRVSGTPLFYAGWRADVDLAPLWALRGSQFAPRSVYGGGGTYATEHVSGSVYRVTGTNWNASRLRDDTPVSFHVCG